MKVTIAGSKPDMGLLTQQLFCFNPDILARASQVAIRAMSVPLIGVSKLPGVCIRTCSQTPMHSEYTKPTHINSEHTNPSRESQTAKLHTERNTHTHTHTHTHKGAGTNNTELISPYT